MSDGFEALVKAAKGYRPDTARAELGFETRLMARIRELSGRGEAAGGFWIEVQRWLWGSAAGFAPVVILLVAWLLMQTGFSAEPFTHDAVGYLTTYLPLEILRG